jgi:hypothetical protein
MCAKSNIVNIKQAFEFVKFGGNAKVGPPGSAPTLEGFDLAGTQSKKNRTGRRDSRNLSR